MNFLISVVTPTHNRFEYLKQAIESVQSNVLVPFDFQFEHIIHDCGSTDGTKEYFLSNLAAEQIFFVKDKKLIPSSNENRTKIDEGNFYKNLIYIRSESKAPPSQARHICIEKARGRFLCVLVSSNRWRKSRKSTWFFPRMTTIFSFNGLFTTLPMEFNKIQHDSFLLAIFYASTINFVI